MKNRFLKIPLIALLFSTTTSCSTIENKEEQNPSQMKDTCTSILLNDTQNVVLGRIQCSFFIDLESKGTHEYHFIIQILDFESTSKDYSKDEYMKNNDSIYLNPCKEDSVYTKAVIPEIEYDSENSKIISIFKLERDFMEGDSIYFYMLGNYVYHFKEANNGKA